MGGMKARKLESPNRLFFFFKNDSVFTVSKHWHGWQGSLGCGLARNQELALIPS